MTEQDQIEMRALVLDALHTDAIEARLGPRSREISFTVKNAVGTLIDVTVTVNVRGMK